MLDGMAFRALSIAGNNTAVLRLSNSSIIVSPRAFAYITLQGLHVTVDFTNLVSLRLSENTFFGMTMESGHSQFLFSHTDLSYPLPKSVWAGMIIVGPGAVNLSHTGMRTLPTHSFSSSVLDGQGKDIFLDLSHNRITRVEENAFAGFGCQQATILLNNNEISSINQGDLTGLRCTSSLRFDHNPVRMLAQNWDEGLAFPLSIAFSARPDFTSCTSRAKLDLAQPGALLKCECGSTGGEQLRGDGSFCSNASCNSVDLGGVTNGRLACAGSVKNGGNCEVVCDIGYHATEGRPVCFGGVWRATSECGTCSSGYQRDEGGDCVSVSSNNTVKQVAVGVPVALLVGLVCAVLGYRYVQRERTKKIFHIFISYRVDTDKHVAQALYHALTATRVDGEPCVVFWDRACLETGGHWREQFLNGLRRSCVFLPLVSEAAVAPVQGKQEKEDNLVLEFETAVHLNARRCLQIFPILMGAVDGHGQYEEYDFKRYGGHTFPDCPSLTQRKGTVQQTMTKLFSIQGEHLSNHRVEYDVSGEVTIPPSLLQAITTFLDRKAWGASDPDGLGLQRYWAREKSKSGGGGGGNPCWQGRRVCDERACVLELLLVPCVCPSSVCCWRHQGHRCDFLL